MKKSIRDLKEVQTILHFIIESDLFFQEYVRKGLAEETYRRGLEIIHSLTKSLGNHPN